MISIFIFIVYNLIAISYHLFSDLDSTIIRMRYYYNSF